MPKVTGQFITDKKEYILECTVKIIREKPLSQITMRDIIKKAGFSHGRIYQYYANLHEIYVDIINKHTVQYQLEQKIDTLLRSKQRVKVIILKCFILLGKYIEELMQSAAGKMFFELMVLYSYDLQKQEIIFPQLQCKQSLEYARNRIMKYIMSNIRKGIIRPRIPLRSLVQFVNGFIDGIALQTALNKKTSVSNISETFQILGFSVNRFLDA